MPSSSSSEPEPNPRSAPRENQVIVRQDLLQIARGFLMGGADAIPGVSGGTVALILGIYPRLVAAISRFDMRLLGLLTGGEIREAAVHVDFRFLFFLLLGVGAGLGGLMSTMHHLLEHEMQPTFAAFFGMIVASCLIVARMVGRFDAALAAGALGGAVFAYWLVGLPLLQNPPESSLWVFFCGAVAICAMILPGISGAFILLILGAYHEITGIVRNVASGELGTDAITTLAAFAAGAATGLLAFSKVLHALLARHRSMTMAVLTGFMVGSLRKIWPFKTDLDPTITEFKLKQFENRLPELTAADTWFTFAVLVVAGALVLILERTSASREGATADSPS